MKKQPVAIFAMLLTVFFLTPAFTFAGPGDLGIALKAGTLGGGVEGTVGILDTLNARVGFNYFSMEHDMTESNVDYEFDLDLLTASLILDWHPFNNGFRVSAGVMYNGNELDATGQPTAGNYTINDTTYTAAQVGTLTGRIDFDDVAPYIGIGYGNALSKDRKWNFVLDIGVMYQGSVDVTLDANGTSSGNAAFRSNLENERRQLQDELDDYQWYPVIAIGISYKF